MSETIGRVWFNRSVTGDNGYLVRSNTDGFIQYVGKVWPEPDISAEAKRSKRKRNVWFARDPGRGGLTRGPFRTRDAAARALI